MLLPASLLLALLAAQPARAANDFVNFPSEFGLNTATTFTWENIEGYVAGIRVVDANSEEGDDNWLLEPDCDDTCTAFANNGSYSFGGSSAVDSSGEAFAVGSGYTIEILYAAAQTYEDVDTATTSVVSPSFSIASTVSTSTSAASSATATTGSSSSASASPTSAAPASAALTSAGSSSSASTATYSSTALGSSTTTTTTGSSTATTGSSSTSTNPTATTSTSANPSSPGSGGLSTGAKAGIAIGAAITLLFLLAIAWFAWRKWQRRRQQLRGLSPEEEKDFWGASAAASGTTKKGGSTTAWMSAIAGKRTGQGKPYLDDKVELPTQPWEGNTHELANSEVAPVPVPAPAPVELPAEPVVVPSVAPARAIDGEEQQPSPDSPSGVSDVTALENGAGAPPPPAADVSPVSPVARPVARKPVPGAAQQQHVVPDVEAAAAAAGPAVAREKSALLRKDKSLIWKMLGGGSLHDRLKPAKGS